MASRWVASYLLSVCYPSEKSCRTWQNESEQHSPTSLWNHFNRILRRMESDFSKLRNQFQYLPPQRLREIPAKNVKGKRSIWMHEVSWKLTMFHEFFIFLPSTDDTCECWDSDKWRPWLRLWFRTNSFPHRSLSSTFQQTESDCDEWKHTSKQNTPLKNVKGKGSIWMHEVSWELPCFMGFSSFFHELMILHANVETLTDGGDGPGFGWEPTPSLTGPKVAPSSKGINDRFIWSTIWGFGEWFASLING